MPTFPYSVTCATTKGDVTLITNSDVGPDDASRRIRRDLVLAGNYGAWERVVVVAVASVCAWFAGCDNISTGAMSHPIIGDVPICDRCRERAERAATTGHERW